MVCYIKYRQMVVDGVEDRQQQLLQQQHTQQKQEQQAFATKAVIKSLEGAIHHPRCPPLCTTTTRWILTCPRWSGRPYSNNSYWGPGWDNNNTPSGSSTSLAVPMGRKVGKDSRGRLASWSSPTLDGTRGWKTFFVRTHLVVKLLQN